MREPDEPATPGDLPSDIEHDLVNSVAAIIGFSQLIRRDPSLPDDLRQSAELLIEEATRTRRLAQVLLDVVRQRTVEAPIAARLADGAQDVPSATATSVARPTVLVLDDEPTFRIFLEKALTALGYDPKIASRGAEAVELAAAGEHAVLLVDHQMPGMSGIDVYEAMVAAGPDVGERFVLMSGDVLDPALVAFAATHTLTLLPKPFDLGTLDRTLRRVIEAAAQSRG